MKILFISYNDNLGGANNASYRLYKNMKNIGFDVCIYCVNKFTKDKNIFEVDKLSKSILPKKIKALFNRFYNFLITKNFYSSEVSLNIFPTRISNLINNSNCDLVHFHYIGSETISLNDIGNINKKIIFTFHDFWPLQGIRHLRTNKIKSFLKGDLKKMNIIDKIIFKKKIKNFKNISVAVLLNKEMYNFSKKSILFKRKELYLMKNSINQKIYKPLQKKKCKKELNLNKKKYILFGSATPFSDNNKNFKLVVKLSNYLIKKYKEEDLGFIFFGNSVNDKKLLKRINIEYIDFGFLKNEKKIAQLYNASDVLLCPSYYETLNQMAIESISCGTPVVAFNQGGLKDIVSNGVNGYLIKKYSFTNFFERVEYILNNKKFMNQSLRKEFHKQMRKYSNQNVARDHAQMYKNVFEKN